MRKANHVQYDIEYHIVWTTKYRYRVLDGKIALRVRELIRQSCNSMGVSILKGSVGKEYIHFFNISKTQSSIYIFLEIEGKKIKPENNKENYYKLILQK